MSTVSSKILSIKIYSVLTHISISIFIFTILACHIGESNRANTNFISNFQIRDLASNYCDLTYDFMAWAARIISWTYFNWILPHYYRPCKISDWQIDVYMTLSLTYVYYRGKNLKGYLTRSESLLVKTHATPSAS